MGQQIAFQCAGHGFDVALYDVAPPALESARERIATYAESLIAGGVIAAEVRGGALARITMTTDPSVAAADALPCSTSAGELSGCMHTSGPIASLSSFPCKRESSVV